MIQAIDYIAEAESGGGGCRLSVAESIELDAALFGGERTAIAIASDFGVSLRHVERRKAKLRGLGFRIPVPEVPRPEIETGWRAYNARVLRHG